MPAARGPHKLRGAYYTRILFVGSPRACIRAVRTREKLRLAETIKAFLSSSLPFSPSLLLFVPSVLSFSLSLFIGDSGRHETRVRRYALARVGYRTRGEAQGFWATQAIKPEDLATPIAIIVITRHALQCKC